jgi:hypothetical protein
MPVVDIDKSAYRIDGSSYKGRKYEINVEELTPLHSCKEKTKSAVKMLNSILTEYREKRK